MTSDFTLKVAFKTPLLLTHLILFRIILESYVCLKKMSFSSTFIKILVRGGWLIWVLAHVLV